MSITAGGIGSGLDVESLVQQLVAAEGATKKQLLSRQESTLQAELSAFGKLKSALSSFQDALADLKDASAFQTRSATSSDETAFTATATSAASNGSYDLQVTETAVQHKLIAGTTYADTDTTTIGAAGDTMTLDVGGNAFTVDIGGKTLGEIRDAINNAADNTGVSATIVNDGSGYRLSLTADETGSTGYTTVTYSAADTFALDDSYQAGVRGNTDGTLTAAELDASFTVDGMVVTSSTNSVSGVIEGVTIELKGATSGTETLSVALDKESAKESVEAFVESYNKLVDTMNSVSAYNGGNPAALFGDSAVRSMDFRLGREITSVVSTTSGTFSTLAEIGITTDDDGKLVIDSTELTDAMDADFDGVGELFAGTDGYAVSLDAAMTEFLDTDGLVDARTDGINSRLEDIEEQRLRLEDRLASIEERYRREFTALDVAMMEMQSTSSYLSQQLAALPS